MTIPLITTFAHGKCIQESLERSGLQFLENLWNVLDVLG